MPNRKEVAGTIFKAIDKYNQTYPENIQLEKSLDSELLGDSGNLDSIGIINLITLIETTVEDDLGIVLTLADERAFSSKENPFRTVGKLIDYVEKMLAGNEADN